MVTDLHGPITHWNRGAEALFGYTAEEMLGAFEQQLIGIVSHDLRTPLTVMRLAASTLLRRKDFDERATRQLARIVSNGQRASRMIRDLLDFTQARLGGSIALERTPTDLHLIVRNHGVWDGDRMAQVLTNLPCMAAPWGSSPPPSTAPPSRCGCRVGTSHQPVPSLGLLLSGAESAQPGGNRPVPGTSMARSGTPCHHPAALIPRGHASSTDAPARRQKRVPNAPDRRSTRDALLASREGATIDMASTIDVNRALPPTVARKLISSILADGRVGYSRHAREEMEKDDPTEVDVTNVLKAGRIIEPAEMGQVNWTYRVHPQPRCVVVAFRSDAELVVVTAWRKKR